MIPKAGRPFARSPDWKDTLRGLCPCVTRFPKDVQDSCAMAGKCSANTLRLCLSFTKPLRPRKIDLMVAFLRCGAFTRKQLIEMMSWFFSVKPKATDQQIAYATRNLETVGRSVMRNDKGCYVVYRKKP